MSFPFNSCWFPSDNWLLKEAWKRKFKKEKISWLPNDFTLLRVPFGLEHTWHPYQATWSETCSETWNMIRCTCVLPREENLTQSQGDRWKSWCGEGRRGGECTCTNTLSPSTEMVLSPEIIWWRGKWWHLMFINNASISFQVGSIVAGCQKHFSITNLISGLCFYHFAFIKGMWKWKIPTNEVFVGKIQ